MPVSVDIVDDMKVVTTVITILEAGHCSKDTMNAGASMALACLKLATLNPDWFERVKAEMESYSLSEDAMDVLLEYVGKE